MRNCAKGVFLALVMLVQAPVGSTADVPSDILPDSWSGLIALEWKSGIPDDSPLHQQIERVIMKYRKEWVMRVDLREINRSPERARYRCDSASVDYLQTSKTDAKNGAVQSKEDWEIKAEDRMLEGHHCNLVLVVDAVEKRYWIEVGGFEIPDARKIGQIVIGVSGGPSVTEPIDKETNVIEPIRFKGEYSDPRPEALTGLFDANVEPPPGIDMTHATLGGEISWQLYRWDIPWLEDSIGSACPDFLAEVDDGSCRLDDLCFCLFVSTVTGADSYSSGTRPVTVEECLELYCPWAPGTPEFDAALDIIKENMIRAR